MASVTTPLAAVLGAIVGFALSALASPADPALVVAGCACFGAYACRWITRQHRPSTASDARLTQMLAILTLVLLVGVTFGTAAGLVFATLVGTLMLVAATADHRNRRRDG
ncbi:MAG: hypothetical protein QOK36_144 [Gaiellales bacterium]|jgi:membrane associated rhomboid family serine protease|nr:hypothetical protein [Gaiellales bacterium]